MAPVLGVISFEGPLAAMNDLSGRPRLTRFPDVVLTEVSFAPVGESVSSTEACDVRSMEGWFELATVGASMLSCVNTDDWWDHEEFVPKLGAFEGMRC